MPPSDLVRFLDWDSAHFGLRIGRVVPTGIDGDILRIAEDWADSASIDCMYLLVDSNDPTAVRIAGESGWRMVDLRVTLGANVPDDGIADSSLRAATTNDITDLKQLAKRSHRDSRFYADGKFPLPACDGLYVKWIERSVRDRDFAGAVFVPETTDGHVAGYITCAMKEGVGEIGLIAVDEKMRRMGIGKKLIAESVRWFGRQGAQRVLVVTQGCNIPAIRMYERAGFNIESIQLWFHRWR